MTRATTRLPPRSAEGSGGRIRAHCGAFRGAEAIRQTEGLMDSIERQDYVVRLRSRVARGQLFIRSAL
jgi:hypothetical protein